MLSILGLLTIIFFRRSCKFKVNTNMEKQQGRENIKGSREKSSKNGRVLQDASSPLRDGTKGGSRSLTMGYSGSTSSSRKEAWVTMGYNGSTSSSRKEATPVQRSATSNQSATGDGASSSSQQNGERLADSKVEMEIDMILRDGRVATTKYKVNSLTCMRSVMLKVENSSLCKLLVQVFFCAIPMKTYCQVAAKMGKDINEVRFCKAYT